MSLISVYNAIETKLTASATFSGYTFLRHTAEKPNKTRVPFLQLVFKEERSTYVKKWGVQSRAIFELHVFWNAASTDIDSITRLTEFSTRKTAILKALLDVTDNEWLGLQCVAGLEISIEPLVSSKSLEEISNLGLLATITVDYYEGRA